MDAEIYLLLTDSDQTPDIIYSRNSDLKIKVYCLNGMKYTPEPNEIQLYSYYKGDLLVFETVNISADDALDMISAIRWYAKYLECPDMEILSDDPRLGHEIAV